MPLIEKFNESPYACKIIGVMETSADDPQLATEIVIAMDGDFISDEHISLVGFLKKLIEEKKFGKTDVK